MRSVEDKRKNDVMTVIVTSQRRPAVTQLSSRLLWVPQMENILRKYYCNTNAISEDMFKNCLYF